MAVPTPETRWVRPRVTAGRGADVRPEGANPRFTGKRKTGPMPSDQTPDPVAKRVRQGPSGSPEATRQVSNVVDPIPTRDTPRPKLRPNPAK